MNDDDSTYLPSVGTNNHTNEEDDGHCNSVIVVMRTLMDVDNLKMAIEELGKTKSSISLSANKQTFNKLFQSALKTNSIQYLDSSDTTIQNLLKTLHLLYKSSNDLQQLLISTLTETKNINQYETQYASSYSNGKEITTIRLLRQQIIKLNKKCDTSNSTIQ